MPVIRPPSPNEKPDSRSTKAYGDLLSGIVEAFRCQLTNTTNKLHAEQGPESSRAFLSSVSALCSSTTEDFALGLCTGIHRASAFFHPDTPPASDAGSPSADSSEEEKTRKPSKAIQSREDKLEKFIANAREALLPLVNNHLGTACWWSTSANTTRRPFQQGQADAASLLLSQAPKA